ncbi:disease resistance protein RPS5-like [Rhodamnia argentea]|uniref:Disease resistance protein RPS5-like n=1 Tax=Rhodamnia argentea TaxID=178133 RepID=A0A8B8QAC1_9MYRT|nr:disease resistance protein RPS5-like [Rhodamnia argentea]
MEIASFVLEIVKDLWGLASKPLGYIRNLNDNVRSLEEANEDLKAMSEDVKDRVKREEEEAGAQRTGQVANWLGKVQEFVGGVDQVLREAGERDRIKCLSRCLPRNCWSSYKLGKRVDQLLNDARQLQHEKGEFRDVTSPLPPPQVLEMPMVKTVGLDVFLNKVWKWLVDEKQVRVIGLYGKGGVGKTTLMKRINEELLHANHGFDIVIWVVVSRQVNEDSIRDAIRKRLHIQDESWNRWSQEERVNHLCDALTRKKFVLLIDDVWRRLDLSNIGVAHHSLENGSKVVFTTRLEHVCDQMEADKTLEVQCLTREEALKLFEKNVGKSLVDCHQEIRDLAKDIAEECKGLPLALITVGRAMARKDNPREWRHALTTLRNNPHKLSGMVEEVYHILEFSYNCLNDSTLQACFLYCCLFPEDYPIGTAELIGLWIGEGFLGYTDDVYRMRDEGESILGDLRRACLLESGRHDDDEEGQYVKMHDVIRDMAAWIARERGQKENKLLVIEDQENLSLEMISKWEEAEKVSVWGTRIRNIDQTPPECSQLETLLLRATYVRFMPRGFFHSMKARLTVLDLSENASIDLFPIEICDLIYLRYLNMSHTFIKELPQEIKNLTRLRWLLLDNISPFVLIPTGAIRNLPLNVLSLWTSYIENEEEIVQELGGMQHLTDLSIIVFKSSSALKIFESPSLQRSIRRARITGCKGLTRILISRSPTGNGGFPRLEVLHLYTCSELVKVEVSEGIGRAPNCSSCFPSLVQVDIYDCGLSDLSWLVHAPKLRELKVDKCCLMKRLIGGEFTREELAASGLFSSLETLTLADLPNLTSICDRALFFPQGVSFRILGCPGLRKLPWDSDSARGSSSFSVYGDSDWWATFEWDPAARVTLQGSDGSPGEEMTYGEASRKIKDRPLFGAKIGFLQSE